MTSVAVVAIISQRSKHMSRSNIYIVRSQLDVSKHIQIFSMGWPETEQLRPIGERALGSSDLRPRYEMLESKVETEHDHYLSFKVILPIVLSLCLAIFLTALVRRSCGSLNVQLLMNNAFRIGPLSVSRYQRFPTTSNLSTTLRGTRAGIYLHLLHYNYQ